MTKTRRSSAGWPVLPALGILALAVVPAAAQVGLQLELRIGRGRPQIVPVPAAGRPAAGTSANAPGDPPAPPPPATADVGVVDLSEAGFLTGVLEADPEDRGPEARMSVAWRSPSFTTPLDLRLDELVRIRFGQPPRRPPPEGSWWFKLAGGDLLLGSLEAIDGDSVTLVGGGPLLGGRTRIKRSGLVRMSRSDGGGAQIVPGDAAGWRAEPGDVAESAGRLVLARPRTLAARDVAAPSKACFEMLLAWDERPEFDVAFAADLDKQGKMVAGGDGYRIELFDGNLVAIREGPRAGLDLVQRIPEGGGRLRLQAFVDQEAGRLALVLPESAAGPGDDVVFDRTISSPQPSAGRGIAIGLRAGGVRLDELVVTAWDGGQPRLAGGVYSAGDGIESYDKQANEFVVREDGETTRLPAAEIKEILFANRGPVADPGPGTIVAGFADGGRLTGTIHRVSAEAVEIACEALVEPAECARQQLVALDSIGPRGRRPAAPGRVGMLMAEGARVAGSLASPAPGRPAELVWQANAATAGVGIDAVGRQVRIVYGDDFAGRQGHARQSFRRPAIVHLKTGDSLECHVIHGDAEAFCLVNDQMPPSLIPVASIRAVELLPASVRTISRAKFDRLLTLPRLQAAVPPTQMLRLTTGDYLRGRLVSLDDETVRFDVLGRVQEIPRSQVSRLIWVAPDDAGQAAEDAGRNLVLGAGDDSGRLVQAQLRDRRRLTMVAERVDGDLLVGSNGVFGPLTVDLRSCRELLLGRAALEAPSDPPPFSQWKFTTAQPPRALLGRDPEPPAADTAPPPEAAGAAAAIGRRALVPPLPRLHPGAAPETAWSLAEEEGQIVVMTLWPAAEEAADDLAAGLGELAGRFAADGVTIVLVAEEGSPRGAVSAVGGPLVVVRDSHGWVARRLGLEAVERPVHALIDRDGRVAATVVGTGSEAYGRVVASVAGLVAGSRRAAGEFAALKTARDLVERRDAACLNSLADLLEADSAAVRRRAGEMLRRLTGESSPESDSRRETEISRRRAVAAAWRARLAAAPPGGSLAFEAALATVPPADPVPPLIGHTLICRPHAKDVVEIDAQGKEIFKVSAKSPWACDVTAEGHRLVGDFADRSLIEYDRDGKEVWAVRNLPGGPMSVRRLADGNTLAALSDSNLVAEFDPQGTMVWQVRLDGRPCDAWRLPEGGTLVAVHRANRIVEVDRTGAVTWSVEGIPDPQAVQRLPDGNTLVALSDPGIVREIDAAGRVLFERQGFRVPVDVQRLPNGHTLVQEQQGALIELDADWEEVGRDQSRGGGSRILRW